MACDLKTKREKGGGKREERGRFLGEERRETTKESKKKESSDFHYPAGKGERSNQIGNESAREGRG